MMISASSLFPIAVSIFEFGGGCIGSFLQSTLLAGIFFFSLALFTMQLVHLLVFGIN